MFAARRFATVARVQVRNNSTQSGLVGGLPLGRPGMGQGGHPNVLQKEGNVAATWFDMVAKPEIVPVVICVGFACSLAAYKSFVVDGMGKPFTNKKL